MNSDLLNPRMSEILKGCSSVEAGHEDIFLNVSSEKHGDCQEGGGFSKGKKPVFRCLLGLTNWCGVK